VSIFEITKLVSKHLETNAQGRSVKARPPVNGGWAFLFRRRLAFTAAVGFTLGVRGDLLDSFFYPRTTVDALLQPCRAVEDRRLCRPARAPPARRSAPSGSPRNIPAGGPPVLRVARVMRCRRARGSPEDIGDLEATSRMLKSLAARALPSGQALV